jgi:hypothetical protein
MGENAHCLNVNVPGGWRRCVPSTAGACRLPGEESECLGAAGVCVCVFARACTCITVVQVRSDGTVRLGGYRPYF